MVVQDLDDIYCLSLWHYFVLYSISLMAYNISTILNANKCLYLCLYITQEQSTILYVLSDGPKEEKFYERVS